MAVSAPQALIALHVTATEMMVAQWALWDSAPSLTSSSLSAALTMTSLLLGCALTVERQVLREQVLARHCW
ncbi:hypothetical protein ABBQ38_009671 [Trebouxia sp. C0009 RCD-2024]